MVKGTAASGNFWRILPTPIEYWNDGDSHSFSCYGARLQPAPGNSCATCTVGRSCLPRNAPPLWEHCSLAKLPARVACAIGNHREENDRRVESTRPGRERRRRWPYRIQAPLLILCSAAWNSARGIGCKPPRLEVRPNVRAVDGKRRDQKRHQPLPSLASYWDPVSPASDLYRSSLLKIAPSSPHILPPYPLSLPTLLFPSTFHVHAVFEGGSRDLRSDIHSLV